MTKLSEISSQWKQLEKRDKIETGLAIGILLFLAVCCWLLCETIVPIYIDDVMYGSWTDKGISHFLEKNWWHINNFNGRTFVHLMLQLVLIFNEHLYAIVMPVMIATTFAGFMKVIKPDATTKQLLFSASAGLALFLGLNHTYLAPTLLWMSGGFNYIFPLFFIIITYSLFLKTKDGKLSILTCLCTLLSGATTEQYGMYTIGLITMTLFYDLIEKKFKAQNLVYLILSGIGYCSIIFSPSTFGRLTNSNAYADTIKMSFVDGYFNNFNYFGGSFGLPMFIVAFMATVGILGFIKDTETKERKYSKLTLLSILFAIVGTVLAFVGMYNLFGVITLIYFGFISIVFGLNKQTRELSKLTVCGFGAFFMMSITMAAGTRTCLPCVVSMIIIMCYVLSEICKNTHNFTKSIAIALVATCFITNFFPLYNGYKAKEAFNIDVYNQFANAKETKEICIDFDETIATATPKYRYPTVFDGCILGNQERFDEAFGVPEDVRYTFKSQLYNVSSIEYDGKYLSMPAITVNEKVYVPLLIGTIIDTYENHNPQGYVSIILNGVEYRFHQDGRVSRFFAGKDTVIAENVEYEVIYQYGGGNRFIELEALCNMMQLMYQYDDEQNTYRVSYNHMLILDNTIV